MDDYLKMKITFNKYEIKIIKCSEFTGNPRLNTKVI